MSENKRPFFAVDDPPRHIDLATINKRRFNSKTMASTDNNTSAMDLDRLSVMVDTTRMQLISPPPEEMLRPTSAVKRKRTQLTTTFSSTPLYSRDVNSTDFDNDLTLQSSQQPMEATPNPKPRKQGRLHSRKPSLESPTETTFRHLGTHPVSNDDTHTPSRSKAKMVLLKSTHANNPDADFIDVSALVLPARRKDLQSAKSSRRSATPFIPYEPPTDVFTPPREVFLSPVTKSSKRKTVASASSFKSAKGKKKGSALTIVTAVKQELPDIDLTLPMPPPSPTDDPLLLLGPPEFDFLIEQTPPRKREMSVQAQAVDEDFLPPSSPESSIAMDEEEEAVRVFDWDCNNGNDYESDDEGEEEAEEQEVRRISVKPEPLLELSEEMKEWEVRQMSVEPEQLLESNEEEEAEEQEVRRMSVEPEQLLELSGEEEEQEVRQMSVEPERLLELNEEEAEEQEVRGMSIEPEQLSESFEEEETEEQEVRRMSVEPEKLLNNEEEEEHDVRQISVELDNEEELPSPFDNLCHLPLRYTEDPACGNRDAFCVSYRSEQDEDDDQISDDSDELSHDIVKITSADPRSAARAAAILKQHDYDCYTNIEIKQRYQVAKHRRKSDIEDSAKESRRRDVFSSGVTKVSNGRRRRRSTLNMGVIGDTVFIPGSPAMTLPELLQEAELEVRDSPRSMSQRPLVLPARGDPFLTPMAAKYRAQTFNVRTADQKVEVCGDDIGEREWTKEDWKHLDACFTDQRLEVGSRLAGAEQNMLASVDMISINDVVDKFVISKGGFETITRFGELWSRENLLERTRALQKKQKSGNIAPPTPYTPLSVVNSNDEVLDSRAPRMQIPDFTPLGRRATLPRKSRPRLTLPQSDPDHNELIVIPPTLLAPRYSHLLEEAIAISQEGSTVSPEQVTFPQSEINDTSHSSDVSSTIAISERGSTPSPKQETFPLSEVKDTSHSSESDVPSTTIGKRVKGLLFSYLPTLPKLSSSTTVSKALLPVQPGLPLPPIEILSKPRGPITTPARAPILKPKHPKELVVLHPAPQPPTISHIPRLKKPQRLVELHPPAPLPVIEQPNPIPRPRRSSGSSVKDLVRGFEEMQTVSRDKLKYNLGWKTYTGDQKRPQWKP